MRHIPATIALNFDRVWLNNFASVEVLSSDVLIAMLVEESCGGACRLLCSDVLFNTRR